MSLWSVRVYREDWEMDFNPLIVIVRAEDSPSAEGIVADLCAMHNYGTGWIAADPIDEDKEVIAVFST